MPTQRWQHFTFHAYARGRDDWRADLGGTVYEGWDAILDALSKRGWEIVSAVPQAVVATGSGSQSTASIRIFMKRPFGGTDEGS